MYRLSPRSTGTSFARAVTPGPYPVRMDHQGHYAEAFCPLLGRCFRLVCSDVAGAQGSPHHCPLPVESFGRFRDSRGRWHEVEACSIHDADIEDRIPIRPCSVP
jgi:hypothetical protein